MMTTLSRPLSARRPSPATQPSAPGLVIAQPVFLPLSLEKLECLFSSLPVFTPNKFFLSLDFGCLDFTQSPCVSIPSIKTIFHHVPFVSPKTTRVL